MLPRAICLTFQLSSGANLGERRAAHCAEIAEEGSVQVLLPFRDVTFRSEEGTEVRGTQYSRHAKCWLVFWYIFLSHY